MRTLVTARHCEIPGSLRARALELIEKLARVAHRPQRAQVVFDVEGPRKTVEVKLSLPRGKVYVATAGSSDSRTALDRAAEKLRHQLDKAPGRRFSRRTVTG
jgi:ribosomal subunit interface protein